LAKTCDRREEQLGDEDITFETSIRNHPSLKSLAKEAGTENYRFEALLQFALKAGMTVRGEDKREGTQCRPTQTDLTAQTSWQ
jgi:hypothetical protein